jgi:hypothetical protein
VTLGHVWNNIEQIKESLPVIPLHSDLRLVSQVMPISEGLDQGLDQGFDHCGDVLFNRSEEQGRHMK